MIKQIQRGDLPLISEQKLKFIQGNEACVEAALACGMRFFAGYPITPSSEIAEILSNRLPKLDGRFIQMEDEIASIAAILGASLAGAKSMTATSGPGFSLMQELIGFGCLCEIATVIVSVQRGGPSTGLPTSPSQADVMQARWGTHGDHPSIVLCPSSVRETYDLTIKAFNFAERFRTPVILLSDEVIAHMREKIEIPDLEELKIINRKQPDSPPQKYLPYAVKNSSGVPLLADFGRGYRYNVTGLMHDETGFPTTDPKIAESLLRRLHQKIESCRKDVIIYQEYFLHGAKAVLFSYGSSARSAQEALRILRRKGMRVGLIKINTLWPFPKEALEKLPFSVRKVFVCEMNLGQLIGEVERVCRDRVKVLGINKVDGKLIEPAFIVDEVKKNY